MASTTRERLIRAAHDLFYVEGFHTVGLDRILAEVAVTKTTFYNHFESKDELILEVLNWHDRWWRDAFADMLRKYGGDRPRDQLLAVNEVLEEMFTGGGYNGCMFINVAVEFPMHHEPAHRAAARHKTAMEDIVRRLAGYAGIDDPDAFTQEYCMILEGAYVTRQVTGRLETSAIVRRLTELVVNNHLPVAA
jgi:AcrR family transcriptional regulator